VDFVSILQPRHPYRMEWFRSVLLLRVLLSKHQLAGYEVADSTLCAPLQPMPSALDMEMI
jgi:hypothetical protein